MSKDIRERFEKAIEHYYETFEHKRIREPQPSEVALFAAVWMANECIKSADLAASFDVEHQIPGGLRQLARELEGGV